MRLTRAAVLARAKAAALDGVRRLNCWMGSLVSDPSPSLFSVNGISDLEPLNQCQNLSELYLRKNNIASLNELFYLKNLPRLRVLWLSENPCCGADPHRYRMTVLRNLPSLQKLDNQGEVLQLDASCVVARDWKGLAWQRKVLPAGCNNICSSSPLFSKIREELGMKPVPREKFSSFSPRETDCTRKKRNNVLNAILLLMRELDAEGLEIVQQTVGRRLQAFQKKDLQEE
ncbi:CU002 protein, partial [Rostratula benghalensis]|nr:CU002 protein [Rostratula benghalensis]